MDTLADMAPTATMHAVPALKPWIADVTLIRPTGDLPIVHLPDTATALVYRRTAVGAGDVRVIGPRSRAAYHPGKDLPICIRIRLRPGAAASALGVSIDGLRDEAVPLTELWGERAVRLENRLNELSNPHQVLGRFEEGLLEGLREDAAPRNRVLREAVDAMSATGERFGALARRLSVSERRLRDLFTEHVGLPPKRFARIERVRRILMDVNADVNADATADVKAAGGWADLASDAGYYDQSHMTADFQSLMGASPAAFRAGLLPVATPCIAAN